MKRVGRTGLGFGRCQNVLLLAVFSAITATLTIAKHQNKVLTRPKLPLIDGLISKVMALVLAVTKINNTMIV